MLLAKKASLEHAHLNPTVAAQLQLVHELGHEVQPAPARRERVGQARAVKRLDVEAPALVFDRCEEISAVK
ncbi:MAG TPA: hypothetical protein VJ787_10295, partial [Thermoleophilia bacterium]|nr:hypothetical protein [Thermoleophilia bacterium]